jgi:hypothetical protein
VEIKRIVAILTMFGTLCAGVVAICHFSEVMKGITGDNDETIFFGVSMIFTFLALDYTLFFYGEIRESPIDNGFFFIFVGFFGASFLLELIIMTCSISQKCDKCLGKYLHEPFVQNFVTISWIYNGLISSILLVLLAKPTAVLLRFFLPIIYRYFCSLVRVVPVEYEP